MSVPAGPTFKRYAANGVATVYSIPFLLISSSDLQITLDGVLVTSGFTLSGISNPTSTCTFAAPPLGDLLFLQVMSFNRPNDYQELGDLLSGTLNRDMDRLWLAMKQVSRDSDRALTVSPLEPEGIPSIPVKAERALKVLGFNSVGDPVVSNMTMDQIEQQPALAVESAQLAEAAASAASSSASAANESAAAAAESAASVDGRAGRFFGEVVMLPNRNSSPNGVIKADGQLISNAIAQYPEVVANLQSGTPSVPVTTPALWLSDPTKRLCWAYDSVANQIRVPDWNGKSAGSLGPAFFRGDGSPGFAPGTLRQDQIQNITGGIEVAPTVGFVSAAANITGAFKRKATSAANGLGTSAATVHNLDFDASLVARTGTETFPTHGVGVWGVVLFGSISNPGAADAAALATSYANQQAQLSALDGSSGFTYVYPNGGSESSPGSAAINARYTVPNPFPGHPIIAVCQLRYGGLWFDNGFSGYTGTTSIGTQAGLRADGDLIVVETGINWLVTAARVHFTAMPTRQDIATAMPIRVAVWRVKG